MNSSTEIQNNKQAVQATTLVLLNLTFFPILAFAILLFIFYQKHPNLSPFSIHHFKQSILACVISGIILIGLSIVIILIGDFNSPYTWTALIIYFTSIHAALILLAVFALTCASAGKFYYYPLLGKFI